MVEIVSAASPEDIERIRVLFQSYAASLDFSLCFQGFTEELASLPGDYVPPDGDLLLILSDGRPVGCVALRPFADGICEMKRLYVDPAYRGRGFGRPASMRGPAVVKTKPSIQVFFLPPWLRRQPAHGHASIRTP